MYSIIQVYDGGGGGIVLRGKEYRKTGNSFICRRLLFPPFYFLVFLESPLKLDSRVAGMKSNEQLARPTSRIVWSLHSRLSCSSSWKWREFQQKKKKRRNSICFFSYFRFLGIPIPQPHVRFDTSNCWMDAELLSLFPFFFFFWPTSHLPLKISGGAAGPPRFGKKKKKTK